MKYNAFGAELDRNGYAPSILQQGERCHMCGGHHIYDGLDRHEVFGGAYRKKSKELGLWVLLCHVWDYLKKSWNPSPVGYCAQYLRYPALENLLSAGLYRITNQIAEGYRVTRETILTRRCRQCFRRSTKHSAGQPKKQNAASGRPLRPPTIRMWPR